MKKLYTLIAATAIAFSASAQRATMPVSPGKSIVNPKLKVTNTPTSNLIQNSRAGGPVWFNYGRFLDDINLGVTPGMAELNFMPLFPDSTITLGLDASSNPVPAWVHKAAVYLDPAQMPFDAFAATDNYLMDSLGIEFAYVRNTVSTVVDTLLVQIIRENMALDYTLSGPPPVYYQDITYNQPNNSLGAGIVVMGEYKIPLTDLDTSSFNSIMYIETPGIPVQTNAKKIGAVISFIPGYTWTQTDILPDDKNAFYVVTLEQNGDNTDQDYYGNGVNTNGDENMSYILHQEVRYNMSTTGWNGYFLPSLAYQTGYAYENHGIWFHLDNTTGVSIAENVNGTKVAQNMPNPFSNSTKITYQLDNAAQVSLAVYDVTGKKVVAQSEGTKQAGTHTLDFNGTDLAAGVYYYSMTLGETTTSTMKMVVVK